MIVWGIDGWWLIEVMGRNTFCMCFSSTYLSVDCFGLDLSLKASHFPSATIFYSTTATSAYEHSSLAPNSANPSLFYYQATSYYYDHYCSYLWSDT